jgi:hypothetical protein
MNIIVSDRMEELKRLCRAYRVNPLYSYLSTAKGMDVCRNEGCKAEKPRLSSSSKLGVFIFPILRCSLIVRIILNNPG